MGLNKLTIISIAVMFAFSLVGIIMFTNIVHELSHKNDLKGLVYDDKVCILEWGPAAARYSYTINASRLDEYEHVKSYTEIKAYGINLVIIIFYSLCLYTLIKSYKGVEQNEFN